MAEIIEVEEDSTDSVECISTEEKSFSTSFASQNKINDDKDTAELRFNNLPDTKEDNVHVELMLDQLDILIQDGLSDNGNVGNNNPDNISSKETQYDLNTPTDLLVNNNDSNLDTSQPRSPESESKGLLLQKQPQTSNTSTLTGTTDISLINNCSKIEAPNLSDIESTVTNSLLSPQKRLSESENAILDTKVNNTCSDLNSSDSDIPLIKTSKKKRKRLKKSPLTVKKPPDGNKNDIKSDSTFQVFNKDDSASDCVLDDPVLKIRDKLEELENVVGKISAELNLTKDLRSGHSSSKEECVKRTTKKPLMSDFEYNMDVIKKTVLDQSKERNEQMELENDEKCQSEHFNEPSSSSKRSLRTTARLKHYEENSDEDPFASVELFNESPSLKKRKGCYNSYYSDDEYVPQLKRNQRPKSHRIMSSDSTIDEADDIKESKARRRKHSTRKTDSKSKKASTDNKDTMKINSDICDNSIFSDNISNDTENTLILDNNCTCSESDGLKTCLVHVDEKQESKSDRDETCFEKLSDVGTGENIQNILGNKNELKVTIKQGTVNTIQPLEIPVLIPTELRKLIEISTQTEITNKSSYAQTSSPYSVKMKDNLVMSVNQSENACEFLNNVLKSTSELGQLICEKSNEFIQKKINTVHMKDTMKLDYCIQKAFLLFKLAKDNLTTMEESLGKQYEDFLVANGLNSAIEIDKKMEPKRSEASSDSDCEIIEEPVKPKTEKFNPKTVFLNKELSIKIAKKTSENSNFGQNKQKINIKGRHSVWINDSVMVKKVKPVQSFLAQDSRFKKPPDYYVREECVKKFFDDYYGKKICIEYYTSLDWLYLDKKSETICNYFFLDKPVRPASSSDLGDSEDDGFFEDPTQNENIYHEFNQCVHHHVKNCNDDFMFQITKQPKALSAMCVEVLHQSIYLKTKDISKVKKNNPLLCSISTCKIRQGPKSLFHLCIESVIKNCGMTEVNVNPKEQSPKVRNDKRVPSLRTLSLQKAIDVFNIVELSNPIVDTFQQTTMPFDISAVGNSVRKIIFEDETSVSTDSMDIFTDIPDNNILRSIDTSDAFHGREFHQCIKNIPLTLKSITYRYLKLLLYNSENASHELAQESSKLAQLCHSVNNNTSNEPQPLFDITSKLILNVFNGPVIQTKPCTYMPEVTSLKVICIGTINMLMLSNCSEDNIGSDLLENWEFSPNSEDDSESNSYCYDDNDELTEHSTWEKQIKVKGLTGTTVPNILTQGNCQIENSHFEECNLAQIKVEPIDDNTYIEETNIKCEIEEDDSEMVNIPDNVITKAELCNHYSDDIQQDTSGNSLTADVDSFESFVCRNKMIRGIIDENIFQPGVVTDDTFPQCPIRVRRQFEPDSDNENENGMSLLVPHGSEPVFVEAAKNKSTKGKTESNNDKKKDIPSVNRRRKRQRKQVSDVERGTSKTDKVENKASESLQKRGKEKTRNDEKATDSTDSETECLYALNPNLVKDTNNAELTKVSNIVEISPVRTLRSNKTKDNEIQCNNVDSTNNSNEGSASNKKTKKLKKKIFVKDSDVTCSAEKETPNDNTAPKDNFSGFSAIDQSATSNYKEYVHNVFEKIIPQMTSDINSLKNNNLNDDITLADFRNGEDFRKIPSPPLVKDEPIELLECEPTIPLLDNSEEFIEKYETLSNVVKYDESQKTDDMNKVKKEICTTSVTVRDGWHCHQISGNDEKLYRDCSVPLDKLPESFVQNYFEYFDLNNQNSTEHGSEYQDHIGELQPSDNQKVSKISKSLDDENDVFDNLPLKKIHDEKHIYSPIKQEDDLRKSVCLDDNKSHVFRKFLTGPMSNRKWIKRKVVADPSSLVLTVDKMMKQELDFTYAPTVPTTNAIVPAAATPKRAKDRSLLRACTTRDNYKAGDDSSSEEEKMWVNTKEKLLKRMEKRWKNKSVDDAKRAKLVNEFIERCNIKLTSTKKRGRGKRSKRKLLERQKQLRVLTNELLKETLGYDDPTNQYISQKKSVNFTQKRRNIRKVLDKKSLAKSTVLANMEEFERKRRLCIRQKRLRDLLGYEDAVNVVVIDNEVCLEYDFENMQPQVSVHPFFTKVMKAHQYEGVKFMWDACFESLEMVTSGHPGGGCILAHCMGLGKTLQVLALLHTVLTHPQVGMRRVLVCCPLSTVLNWVDEIHKWLGPVTNEIKVFELSKLKKTYERAYQLEDWYNGGGIFIIGYELFRSLTTLDPSLDDVRPTIINKIRNALLDPGPDIVVCDEGHLLKNDCSVLAVSMSRVKTKRRIVLTGTPMQNNLREYYCMVNFVKPNLLGTYTEYSNRFGNPIVNGQHRDSSEEDIKLMKARSHILHKVLEGCLQRQEASVLYPYLPTKHEYTVFISLTKCQSDLYKYYLQNLAQHNKQNILKDFHILQKIWTHPHVLHNFQMKVRNENTAKAIKEERVEDDLCREDLTATEDVKPPQTEVWWLDYLDGGKMLETLESSNKFVAVFKILEECVQLDDKILIFSTSLFTMDSLEYFLKKINKWSLGQDYYRLDGSVPPEVRHKWCREFNSEYNHKTRLFLISTRAGSLGLNMTAANRVIILDTSWNPAHDIQSIFRVYRFGQKKDCYIYRLVAMGTMEQKIYERSVIKQAISCRVVDEQQIDRHYSMAELTELYRFDELGEGVPSGVSPGVRDVALLRVARDTSALHAVHEHDSLLRDTEEQELPEDERAAAWDQFQQEQAHKQMQDQLPKKEKKVSHKKSTHASSAYIGHIIPNVPENILPDNPDLNDDIFIDPKDPEYKPWRQCDRRKTKPAKQTATSEELNQTVTQASNNSQPTNNLSLMDDGLVGKITEILVQHNYHHAHEGLDISSLVKSVSTMISNFSQGVDIAMNSDPQASDIAKKIAEVLMQHNENQATDTTSPENYDKSTPPHINLEQNNVHLVNSEKNDAVETVSGTKPRRSRKAIQKNKEENSSPSIHFISTDSIIPSVLAKGKMTEQVNKVEESKIEYDPDLTWNPTAKVKSKKRRQKRPETKKLSNDKQPIYPTTSTVILSDDEDVPESLTKKPKSSAQKELVPLHPTLLSNQYFIKIVAHTYLKGNPILDEDAAMRAAEYSTSKLLEESKASNTEVKAGPIYEIALMVLGRDTLQELWQNETATNKEMQVEPTTAEQPQPIPGSVTKGPHPMQALPVGLITRPTQAPAEESILPDDDDDIRITSSPVPVLPVRNMNLEYTKQVEPQQQTAKRKRRRNKKEIVSLDVEVGQPTVIIEPKYGVPQTDNSFQGTVWKEIDCGVIESQQSLPIKNKRRCVKKDVSVLPDDGSINVQNNLKSNSSGSSNTLHIPTNIVPQSSSAITPDKIKTNSLPAISSTVYIDSDDEMEITSITSNDAPTIAGSLSPVNVASNSDTRILQINQNPLLIKADTNLLTDQFKSAVRQLPNKGKVPTSMLDQVTKEGVSNNLNKSGINQITPVDKDNSQIANSSMTKGKVSVKPEDKFSIPNRMNNSTNTMKDTQIPTPGLITGKSVLPKPKEKYLSSSGDTPSPSSVNKYNYESNNQSISLNSDSSSSRSPSPEVPPVTIINDKRHRKQIVKSLTETVRSSNPVDQSHHTEKEITKKSTDKIDNYALDKCHFYNAIPAKVKTKTGTSLEIDSRSSLNTNTVDLTSFNENPETELVNRSRKVPKIVHIEKEKLIGTVDLTRTPSDSPAVTSTSKSIVINTTGKALGSAITIDSKGELLVAGAQMSKPRSKPNILKVTNIDTEHLKSKSKSNVATWQSDVAKKTDLPSTSKCKTKKTGAMTLEDFSLDDYEDIIELE